ncbi:MAG: KH domain-containing protein, partial [Bacteroidota bacterium]
MDQKKLGLFIGTGGKNIKEMSQKTKTNIKTTQEGVLFVSGEDIELIS